MEDSSSSASIHERETMGKRLYEASVSGDVQAFDALIEEDGLILDRIPLTCFDETPLHIAALRGHVDFTRALLSRNPKLASELDSLGRSPLHVACAEGYADVASKLLRANDGARKIRDCDGMTPLHVAAAKGRLEVVRELLLSQGRRVESTQVGGEESVLHLCVKYNRLDALKLVVEWMMSCDNGHEFVKSKDTYGNTILHLAAALKQMETIEYLLQIPSVKEAANAQNHSGFTALDVLELCPIRDLKSMKTCDILLKAGVQKRTKPPILEPPKPSTSEPPKPPVSEKKPTFWSKWPWLMSATGIGGIAAGASLFIAALVMASLSTILLTNGIFPLKNKVVIWLLMNVMCIASMAIAYLISMRLGCPSSDSNKWHDIEYWSYGVLPSFYTCIGICAFVIILLLTVRWLLSKKKPSSATRRVKDI